MVAELNGKTHFLDEKLMKYRRHEENTSSFQHLPFKKMLTNRINYTKEILRYKRDKEK